MGAWGTQPFDNDGALDLKGDWEDTHDIAVLEEALDTVLAAEAEEYIDAMDGEAAIAAVHIIVTELQELPSEQYTNLLQKSAGVLGRLVENSEIKDLWMETESFGDWLTSITELMQMIVAKLQSNE